MYNRALIGFLSALLFILLALRAHGGSQPDLSLFTCQIASGIAGGPVPTDERINEWYDEQTAQTNRRGEGQALPLREFEPNFGQTDSRYPWLSRGEGFYLFLRPDGAAMDMRTSGGRANGVIAVDFEGANPNAAAEAGDFRSLQHYLLGARPEKWVTDVPVFTAVTFTGVYPGIDLTYYQRDGLLEHDWIVRPGADLSRIRMRFSPGTGVRLDAGGNLILQAGEATVRWQAPRSYEMRSGRSVASHWRMDAGGTVSIDAARTSAGETLVIDPPIEYLTYLGRSGYEISGRSVTDAQGNLYLTGVTSNGAWPATPGAPLNNLLGFTPTNAVVSKLSSDGKQLLFSTIFGGTYLEAGVGIALDPQGNILLTGATTSDDFPTTPSSVQPTAPALGAADPNVTNCFVLKLNAAGTAPVFGTYLGGTKIDACTAIASDPQGNVYVAGYSNSSDFVTTDGVAGPRYRLPTAQGAADLIVVKLNPAGTERIYSTYLGGSGDDMPSGMAVDGQGAVYLTGSTSSTNFPVTGNAIRGTFSGGNRSNLSPLEPGDAFVLKLARDASSIVYATYLGGSSDDVGYAIQVDGQGNAYVAGSTMSTNFPLTQGAYQAQYRGAGGMNFQAGDCFVSKVNPTGTQLVYSTLLGGTGDERCMALGVDVQGSAWVGGHTHSRDFPVTADAVQTTNRTGIAARGQVRFGDAFVANLSADGTRLNFSTYLGGSGHEMITGLALSAEGQPTVTGFTSSRDLPATAGSYQPSYFGGVDREAPFDDLFVAKFGGTAGVSLAAVANAASYSQNRITPGMIVTLTGTGIGPGQLTTGSFVNNRFTTTVGGTRFLFDGTPAPIIYVSGGQSSVVAPYDVAGKQTVQVVAERDGVRSAPLAVTVVEAAPGLFSANSSGQGPGAILNQDNTLNSPQNPIVQGGVIILYGTGEGRVSNTPADGSLAGQPLPTPVLPVRVTVAGRECNVLYAGAAPGLVAGLFQVNAQLPAGIPSGNQAVVVTVGTAASQNGLTVAVQ